MSSSFGLSNVASRSLFLSLLRPLPTASQHGSYVIKLRGISCLHCSLDLPCASPVLHSSSAAVLRDHVL